jgi:hypothetical protein
MDVQRVKRLSHIPTKEFSTSEKSSASIRETKKKSEQTSKEREMKRGCTHHLGQLQG